MKKLHNLSHSGFTLIELSIVLVIIGLIVGGVLVGQDLIHAAAIRSQISQIEKLNTSVRTFQGKFGGLPGDLLPSQSASFGFFNTGMDGTVGKGNGDGLLQDYNGNNPVALAQRGEILVFWQHLSSAGMIEGNFGSTMVSPGRAPGAQTQAQASLWYPQAKVGNGGYIIVYSVSGVNYYEIVAFTNQGSIDAGGGYWKTSSTTPLESQAIDSKVDDGFPLTGAVLGMKGGNGNIAIPVTAGDGCAIAGTPVAYDTGATNGSVLNCAISFRFQ